MNRIPLLLIALLLTACEKPMPFESAEVLAENPRGSRNCGFSAEPIEQSRGMPNAM